MPNPKTDDEVKKEPEGGGEETNDVSEKGEEPEQEPAAPTGDPMTSFAEALAGFTAMMGEMRAEMQAQREAIGALANQGALDASLAAADGESGASGEGEGEEDYPEIDLEEFTRLTGAY